MSGDNKLTKMPDLFAEFPYGNKVEETVSAKTDMNGNLICMRCGMPMSTFFDDIFLPQMPRQAEKKKTEDIRIEKIKVDGGFAFTTCCEFCGEAITETSI